MPAVRNEAHQAERSGMAARKCKTTRTLKAKAKGKRVARSPSWADLENWHAFRHVTEFCDRLRRGQPSERDLERLLEADGAIRGLNHTEQLRERRAGAVALVAKALPRLTTVEPLDRLLDNLAQKVDPRFGTLRVPLLGREATKRHRRKHPGAHLTKDLETITQPRRRAVRATAWLALRSGALTGPGHQSSFHPGKLSVVVRRPDWPRTPGR
jgi:hypothetical protein